MISAGAGENYNHSICHRLMQLLWFGRRMAYCMAYRLYLRRFGRGAKPTRSQSDIQVGAKAVQNIQDV